VYRLTIALLCMIAALVTGCTSAQHNTSDQRNPARWRLYVPRGWHVLRFSYTRGHVRSAAIQLSTVRLPRPTILPQKGTTVEVSGNVLPPGGVGLVITPDDNRAMTQENAVAAPLPLPWPDASGQNGWLLGSSPGPPAPIFEWLKFRVHHATYVAAVTLGWKAGRDVTNALGRIIRSINPRANGPVERTRPVARYPMSVDPGQVGRPRYV
jgi:hypothetical protein